MEIIKTISRQETASSRGALLLVDDEPGIRDLLVMVLEGAGYRCLRAPDGAQALELFQRHHEEIGAIITDVHMPELDGYSLARAAREINPDIKIVISSGSLGETVHQFADALCVSAFLPKPYTSPQLIACVSELFQEQARGAELNPSDGDHAVTSTVR